MGENPKADTDKTEKEKEHRSYYYDDAHGYQDYIDDDDDEDDDGTSALDDRKDVA